MNDERYFRTARVVALVNGYSPMLREAVLTARELTGNDGLATDTTIILGKDGVSFRCSTLLPAITKAFDTVSSPVIQSAAGEDWSVTFAAESEPPNVVLMRGGERMLVAQFALLSPEADARLRALQAIAEQYQLPEDVLAHWRAVISARTPTDSDITAFGTELQQSTMGVVGAIREALDSGSLSHDILVPVSDAYFERLVGKVENASTLEEFVSGGVERFVSRALMGGRRDALDMLWLLCSHSLISQVINRKSADNDQLIIDGIARLVENGDPISRTGAIEVGLQRLQEQPGLKEPLAQLLRSVLDEPQRSGDAYELIAALFICTYGGMARCRVLSGWPPVARRLAALAHASLVCRCLLPVLRGPADFVEWLNSANHDYFVMQVVCDMRLEPRWFPELGSAEQWRHELLGRVWMASQGLPDAIRTLGLADRMLVNDFQAAGLQLDLATAHLPGPLEGGVARRPQLSSDKLAELEACLKDEVNTSTFSRLVNLSLWYDVPASLVDLAADALDRCQYQIAADDRAPFAVSLLGLASVAAVSRNEKLREAIHKTLRVSWRLTPGALTVEESFNVGAMASATHVDLFAWSVGFGQFMTELALQDMSAQDAELLQSRLLIMCHLVPELWGTCGHAHAALGIVLGR